METFKNFSQAVAALATVGALLWAIIFGYYIDYRDTQARSRVDKTLEYVHRFSDGNVADAQTKISAAWNSSLDKLAEYETRVSQKDDKEKTEEELNQEVADYKMLILDVVRERNIEKEIWTIVDVYESISICVDKNICDEETAKEFFLPYGSSFINLHWPYIEELRVQNNDMDYAADFYKFLGIENWQP